ncbi:unnamed protein product [Eruca vesicaria subsp. sativa]|uniref:DC1 domain-containing protein n=1 Tax=Eruca vesicaria subsp. sativa TaxID=29727 RepID=A0ABC8LGS7_ERUVS|nr:unnamed protein product [Eruca vesicaria subsp. sativa]
MAKLKHGAHECVLTSPEIIANGICNICFKDEPIEFSCDLCNFDLCRPCSKLPLKVSHGFHPQHPLEFCLGNREGNEGYKLCSGCGHLFSDLSLYYKCKDCEIFLDLGCAVLNNIETSWYAEEKLHYSHAHLLRRCKPGPDANNAKLRFKKGCQVCMKDNFGDHSYQCVECGWMYHFDCLKIPQSVVKKSYHIHPLVCQIFFPDDDDDYDSLEYCGVCETRIHAGLYAYCCLECGFVSHIECMLHEEVPSPMYLKDLYSHGEKLITRPPADHDDECETTELENKLVVIDVRHNHVLKSRNVTASQIQCKICYRKIHGRLWECDQTCDFKAHDNCVKLRQQSRYKFHLSHPLTLLPSFPAGAITLRLLRCNICKGKINSFNLFCRICDFIICTKCAVSVKMRLGELQRGQKFIRYYEQGNCLKGGHDMVQVMVSSSYTVACTICEDRLCNENIVSGL